MIKLPAVLRRGRRRGRRRARRRTMLLMNAMDNQNQPDESEDNPSTEEYSIPEDEKSAFSDDDAEQLEKLAELKEKGIITEEEFNQKKKQILGI